MICKKALALGYRSHRANTCGLHIHVSRSAFGNTQQEQDQAIARVLYFFEKHWEELLKFSRRTQRQLERWAARYGYKEHPMDILDFAKKGYHGGRYTCVNLQNPDTVEFRMFRGTLKTNTILATLQLVDQICRPDLQLCRVPQRCGAEEPGLDLLCVRMPPAGAHPVFEGTAALCE